MLISQAHKEALMAAVGMLGRVGVVLTGKAQGLLPTEGLLWAVQQGKTDFLPRASQLGQSSLPEELV